MPERRTAKVPEPVVVSSTGAEDTATTSEPVEYTVSFTGVDEMQWYACPTCGRNGQDKEQIAKHIAEHGGEA